MAKGTTPASGVSAPQKSGPEVSAAEEPAPQVLTPQESAPKASVTAEPADEAQQEAAHPVDAKSAFAAALEKKKVQGQSRSAHLDGHGGVGGATASHKATRTFRRKSG